MSGYLESELQSIETRLDELNGEFGNKQSYCIYCGSTEYNGEVGIVHDKICIMTQLRGIIKGLK